MLMGVSGMGQMIHPMLNTLEVLDFPELRTEQCPHTGWLLWASSFLKGTNAVII